MPLIRMRRSVRVFQGISTLPRFTLRAMCTRSQCCLTVGMPRFGPDDGHQLISTCASRVFFHHWADWPRAHGSHTSLSKTTSHLRSFCVGVPWTTCKMHSETSPLFSVTESSFFFFLIWFEGSFINTPLFCFRFNYGIQFFMSWNQPFLFV